MVEAVFFYLFAGLMLAAAVSVVCNRQPIYSVLSLLVAMFCLASLFIMLGAYFIAALQILLYAGAVLVLFLFVMMLLNLAPETLRRMRLFNLPALGTATALSLLWLMLRVVAAPGTSPTELPPATASQGAVEPIARQLFTTYLLPFELTSFLILAAIIGAVTLAKRDSTE